MKLKRLEVNAFGGINPKSPVVLDFTESKWIKLEGDYGLNKTNLIYSLLVACGQLGHTGKEGKEFINNDTGKIDINFSFVGKDRANYEVRCTKSQFDLKYEGQSLPEPLTKMREILGIVGVSPMVIKKSKISEIIKWLAAYSNKTPEEFELQLKKLKEGIKTSAEKRAEANKSRKAIDEYLTNEDMHEKWEESEKKYAVKPDIEELSKKLEEATKTHTMVMTATQQLQIKQERKESLQKQIEQLQKDIEIADKQILINQKVIDDNPTAREDQENINTQYKRAATDLANYNKWQEIKEKKLQRDEFETLSQQFDAKEKELKQEVKELQAEILPNIKGVELVTEDTHEEGKMIKEGLYWEGKSAAQMSETEFWNFVIMIWRKFKVKVVVIDNYQDLGSRAVELLQKLHGEGAHILTAEMNREQKTLQIHYE